MFNNNNLTIANSEFSNSNSESSVGNLFPLDK